MATLSDIGVAAAINILSAFAFFLAFSFLRIQPINDRVYFPKWYLKGLRSSPLQAGAFVSKFVNVDFRSYVRFLSWMPAALQMPEPELVDHAGLDSAVYLRIYLLGLKIFVPIAFLAFSVMVERILTIFTTIDLSNNLFEGEIPKVIGELNSLKGLNLSHNRINGTIPQSLGNLISLEWLDLSSNKLKGEIPMALTNLTFLSLLNLSQNQLEGIIPQGKQFNTFPNESYAGNSKLCGIPLSRKCNKDEAQPPSSSNLEHEEEESGFGWKAVALGYGCGMVFGMLLGYVVFSTGKPEWLVIIFGGETNKMMRRRIRNRSRANPNDGRRN